MARRLTSDRHFRNQRTYVSILAEHAQQQAVRQYQIQIAVVTPLRTRTSKTGAR